MEDVAHTTCFPSWKKQRAPVDKLAKSRSNHVQSKSMLEAPSIHNLSPLSSVDGDDAIRAHHGQLLENDARMNKPKQIQVLEELANERAKRQNLEDQLASSMDINAEFKLNMALADDEKEREAAAKRISKLKHQLKKERKEREEVEIQLAASRREAGAMRAALNAARSQRDDLEAELMEAALDVMEGEKQRASLQATMKHEAQMRELAQSTMTENEELRGQLAAAQQAREMLEKKIEALHDDAQNWEVALDALQDQLEHALLKRPLDTASYPPLSPSVPDPDAPRKPIQMTKARAAGEQTIVRADLAISGGLIKEPWQSQADSVALIRKKYIKS